jgi:replication fork clamp-binding protein CrfC
VLPNQECKEKAHKLQMGTHPKNRSEQSEEALLSVENRRSSRKPRCPITEQIKGSHKSSTQKQRQILAEECNKQYAEIMEASENDEQLIRKQRNVRQETALKINFTSDPDNANGECQNWAHYFEI